ncbi:hypothetical protein IQ266_11695 [filamentous cyanobacterium LEGE 11480]|uniref:PEP-CTERM sorting domain-containing protein n=1 Tax=Romeriopsis navalis LEGE 11480 TaxID=2777977 RepID=A0A928Z4N4_9CYAN|nr:hypothetical protein [Romeriopsis navalis]MBE9030395.1 hypothetical protein [Romeriopsis navalis LEGE 11480]
MKKHMRVQAQLWFGLPIVTTVVVGAMPMSAIANPLSVEQNFTGLTFQDGPVIPPDSNGAVGREHIVQVTNQGFAVYNKANGQVVQQTSLDQFWASTGLSPANATNNFDPRITYDPTSQRWFSIAADRTDVNGAVANFPLGNRVVLAVSKTADPTQGWQGFALPASQANKLRFADAPNLGIDADGVYIAANMFDAALNNRTSTLFAIAKPALLTAAAGELQYETLFGVRNARYGSSLQPVNDFFNPADGQADFFTTFGRDQLRRATLKLDGSLTPPKRLRVDNFSKAPNALQPNGSQNLETGDPRFSSPIVRVGDSIWGVHTIADPSGNRAVLRWYEIDAVTSQVKQQGEIGDSQNDYFYPSIALNSAGNVVIGFNRSGADEFVGSYAIAGQTRGGMTTFGEPILLKAGTDNYFRTFGFGRNRWGDSSSTVLDPTDPQSFWTFQQVAGDNNEWSTQITRIRVGPTAQTPEPLLGVALLTAAGVGLTITRRSPKLG